MGTESKLTQRQFRSGAEGQAGPALRPRAQRSACPHADVGNTALRGGRNLDRVLPLRPESSSPRRRSDHRGAMERRSHLDGAVRQRGQGRADGNSAPAKARLPLHVGRRRPVRERLGPVFALWAVRMVRVWSSGVVALWPSGVVALWPSGVVALWFSGVVALWSSGVVALWSSGVVALWSSTMVALLLAHPAWRPWIRRPRMVAVWRHVRSVYELCASPLQARRSKFDGRIDPTSLD
jgi:hypothetical protein